MLQLNGGLGTSMGMTGAKSLLEVKDGLSFLDIIARQVLALREPYGARLPLVLMNSFSTREDTLRALERYPELEAGVPLDFVQHKEPKLARRRADAGRVAGRPGARVVPARPRRPLHRARHLRDARGLLERGYEYAFVSNSDNLGAVLDPRILAWLRASGAVLLEVIDRTEADHKGGHLARRKADGQLVLRETAQTPDEDLEALQDTRRHRYVNANNLWIACARSTRDAGAGGVLGLPLIRNQKTVDPSDKSSPRCTRSRPRWARRSG